MEPSLNIVDILFQIFSLAIPITFVVFILAFWRASKAKKEQLNRIEEKLDQLQKNEPR